MVSISEKEPKTSRSKLIQAVKELVEISQQILGPEDDGFQMVKLQFPDGTHSQISRYINIRDDIYTAGYLDPFTTGLSITTREGDQKRTLYLPRRPEAVNENTIAYLKDVSPETITSLIEKLKEIEVAR